jgi:periplasmic protein CpxP/Spy
MKKFLVILAAFSFSAAAVSAQTLPAKAAHGQHHMKGDKAAKTPEQHADHAAQSLTKQLGLSAAQTEQVRQLHLSRAQEMQAYKAQAGTTPATKRQHHEAMKGKKAQYETQLKRILSADQYAKYTQLQSERMAKRKAHQGSKQDKS